MYNITICVSTIIIVNQKKITRGLGDRVGSYDMSRYKYYDKNDVHDELMLRYKSELSKRLKSF